MTHRSEVRFLLNDDNVSLPSVSASDTLLDFLRLERELVGSKEGCAEGDCGACSVLVGRLAGGKLRYESVNACIRFLASLDGCHVVTIEHLRGEVGALHPVQQAMVDFHGSQCGFCTPGIVMSLYAMWMENPHPGTLDIEVALQGNLCRCTGYEPIIKAALAINEYGSPANDYLNQMRSDVITRLEQMADGKRVVTGPEDNIAIIPGDVDDFAAALIEYENPTIVAGATDVGLWVTKFLRPISPTIFIGNLVGLREISENADSITIGAGVSYSEFEPVLMAHFPFLEEYWRRIAGQQVRNMGTIGGNIANGSPIGDTPPIFIAMGATITMRHGSTRRELPLEDFFIDYGKQDMRPGEYLESITIPKPGAGTRLDAYKISKRRDEDISSVAVGFAMDVTDGVITAARVAFGGMAATPKRAANAERMLVGQKWDMVTFEAAAAQLAEDFTPLTDMRASSQYRLKVAQNLFLRFCKQHGDAAAQPVQLLRA